MTDTRQCPVCDEDVSAISGYESRTIYCSRRCEDRAYRRRRASDRTVLAEARRIAPTVVRGSTPSGRRVIDLLALDALLDLLTGDNP